MRIADGLGALAEVPVLLLWGPRDPVFSDRYLRDLRGRLPQADVHRYEGASHLVHRGRTRGADDVVALGARTCIGRAGRPRPAGAHRRRALWAGARPPAPDDPTPAVVELGRAAAVVSFAELDRAGRATRRRAGRHRRAPGRPGRAAGAARRRPDGRASTPAGAPAR